MNAALFPPPPQGPPDRRILSLSLPCLSTDRHRRQMLGKSWRCPSPPGRNFRSQGRSNGDTSSRADSGLAPLAIAAKVKNALRLVALDETAERLGLSRGMALADARAMIPALDIADDDPAADAALLASVADWAERYTPLVALDPPAGLMLDITGCAHLFGGETALLVWRPFADRPIADRKTKGLADAHQHAGRDQVPQGKRRAGQGRRARPQCHSKGRTAPSAEFV